MKTTLHRPDSRVLHRTSDERNPCFSLTKSLFLTLLSLFGFLLLPGAVHAAETSGTSAPGGNAKTSVAALFNEGNSAQRLGRLGPAVLSYERALWLRPGDPEVTHNLQAARDKAGVSTPAVPFWKRPAHWLSFNGTAILGSLSLLLICLLFFSVGLIPPTLRRLSGGASLLLLLSVLFSAGALALRWPELHRAIITAASPATARIAPADNSAPAFQLKPGELVQAQTIHGSWIRVLAADGQSGWVASSDLQKIIPTPGDEPKQVSL